LLRRQRFMRSLTQFMLDPGVNWSDAIDGSYHDQAQFVRDCRQFLGMTPRQYAALDWHHGNYATLCRKVPGVPFARGK